MSDSAMIQVLLVDDHAIVRDGLRSILEATGEIVCTQAESAEQALELLDAKCSIDVVLLDITLPGMNGLEALAEIHKQLPKLAVLLLSMHPEDQFAVRALRMGAIGYLSKSAPSAEILKAVKNAASGTTYLSSHLVTQVALGIGAEGDRPLHESLSNREYEIFRMIGAGKPVAEIGRVLGLSAKTVSTYRERILDKMKLTSNYEIVRYVLQEGLME
jgi:two-component system, NarL family, invasion response regulator UvrY